jgi:pilus assembly protein CpaE
VVRHRNAHGAEGGKPELAQIIGILPTKGGSGATTLACTLTAELARQTEQDCLLVDLDWHSNNLGFMLGVDARYSIADALAKADLLDRPAWDSIVSEGPEGLQVLTSAAPLLHRIRSYYSWIVIDLGQLDEISRPALELADQIVVVTSSSVPSLYQTRELLAALRESIDISRLRLVSVALSSSKPTPASSLEQILPIPLTASLPSSADDIDTAVANKELPPRRSAYRNSVASLARTLAGLEKKTGAGVLERFLTLGWARRRPLATKTT